MKSARTLRVAFWLAVAGMAFFAMAASSPQCARTSDQVMSPGLHSLAGDPVQACKRDCDSAARAAIRVERRRHRLADKACNGDMNCHVEEDAMHAAILAEIESDRAACYVNCEHQQGAGTGGQ